MSANVFEIKNRHRGWATVRRIGRHQLKYSVLIFLGMVFCNTGHPSWGAETGVWKGWGGPNQNFTVENVGAFLPEQNYSLHVVWRKPLGQGYSAISVDEQMAVTMFTDGTSDFVIALDPNDGSELWRYQIGPKHPGRFGSLDGPISTPLIHGNQLIALSAHGVLFALNAKTGELLWKTNLVDAYGALVPFYGFTTSPIVQGEWVIVETGGTDGKAISAIHPQTGRVAWSAVSDTIDYQSPAVTTIHGRDQLIGVGNRHLSGIEPETGEVLWQFSHHERSNPIGNQSANLVAAGPGQFFWKNSRNGGVLLSLAFGDHGYAVEEVWKTKHIKGTYVVPVYYEGRLYGYNSRILTCIDAKTGDRVWRSRQPGDGFPIVVDGHLVVATKDGKLSIARASKQGYKEKVSLDLFDDLIWAPPAFAHGRLFVRSMSEIACVEIVAEKRETETAGDVPGIVPGSAFAAFVAQLKQADDKRSMVDAFIDKQTSFPLIEGHDLVHFIYRGEAQEVSLVGDVVGWRYDRPMHRVAGTDLFYYSSRFEPDARLTYRFTRNLQESITDTLNLRSLNSMMYGKASWFHMPEWQMPEHLKEHAITISGQIDTLTFQSSFRDSSQAIEVYLPAGYDSGEEAYPVAYFHEGHLGQRLGQVSQSLDYLIGHDVRPTIVVFLPRLLKTGLYPQYIGLRRDDYLKTFVEELIPAVDRKYRTITTSEARANIGYGFSGFMALYATFKRPETVSKLAVQSIYWDTKEDENVDAILTPANDQPLQIYLAWGKYDLVSPLEGVSIKGANMRVAELLTESGHTFTGGEFSDGFGWGSWKIRTDRVFKTLFPDKE